MDNCKLHKTTEILNICSEENITVKYLPPNTTSFLQPLDVGFFGAIKQKVRCKFETWLTNCYFQNINPTRDFNFAYRRNLLLNWLKLSLSEMNQDVIKKAFYSSGISFDGKEIQGEEETIAEGYLI